MGPAGANGTNGIDVQGVPSGGTTDQILSKIDGTDFNTQWTDAPIGPDPSGSETITGDWTFNGALRVQPRGDVLMGPFTN